MRALCCPTRIICEGENANRPLIALEREGTNMEGSKRLSVEQMPFYKSMNKVQDALKLDHDALILWQLGFKASPASCSCGHEWSAFDLMLEAVNTGYHSWDFYKTNSNKHAPLGFRSSSALLTCPECGTKSTKLQLNYNYADQCGHCGHGPSPGNVLNFEA
jgi:hypothetical protein